MILCFTGCASVSGLLYYRVVKRIRSGANQNDRKRRLVRAFAFLYISWILCTLPFLVTQTYIYNFIQLYTEEQIAGYKREGSPFHGPEDFYQFYIANSLLDMPDHLLVVHKTETVSRVVKHSYGFINSVLILILIRPFQQLAADSLKTIKSLVKFIYFYEK